MLALDTRATPNHDEYLSPSRTATSACANRTSHRHAKAIDSTPKGYCRASIILDDLAVIANRPSDFRIFIEAEACDRGLRPFAAVNSPRRRVPLVVSLGGCDLLVV